MCLCYGVHPECDNRTNDEEADIRDSRTPAALHRASRAIRAKRTKQYDMGSGEEADIRDSRTQTARHRESIWDGEEADIRDSRTPAARHRESRAIRAKRTKQYDMGSGEEADIRDSRTQTARHVTGNHGPFGPNGPNSTIWDLVKKLTSGTQGLKPHVTGNHGPFGHSGRIGTHSAVSYFFTICSYKLCYAEALTITCP